MNARITLVRWILVVTLGCSLGLILVYVAAWMRSMPDMGNVNNILVTHQMRPKEAAFRLSQEEIEQELMNVIEAQLGAFRKDDYPAAYKYAAAAVKAQFPLPAFERMVRQGFPYIAQSSSAQFGVILDNGEQAVVNVTISGRTGRSRHYQYIMQRESGVWRIGAVIESRQTPSTLTI